MQVKMFKQANDGLEERHKKNIDIIESFEGKILNLENQIDFLSCNKVMICKKTQTDTNINLKCEECNFEAGSESGLGWHMTRKLTWISVVSLKVLGIV
jgi:ssDNA-binding Zn-finger/Zn-ribbon topoisomerase 1